MQLACLLLFHFIAISTAQLQLINNGIFKPLSPPSLPYSTRGITSCCHHPPLASHFEKAATVSFCLFFYFPPPFPMFSTIAFFN